MTDKSKMPRNSGETPHPSLPARASTHHINRGEGGVTESELMALIKREVSLFDDRFGTVDELVARIMDAVNDYAREEASDAAHDAIREYEERM